jgi:hypothetical protein
MKYNVHLFAVVRVKAVDIEAESQTEAIQKGREHILKACGDDLRGVLYENPGIPGIEHAEFNEEFDGYLVDEQGDDGYNRSRYYMPDGVTVDNLERFNWAKGGKS